MPRLGMNPSRPPPTHTLTGRISPAAAPPPSPASPSARPSYQTRPGPRLSFQQAALLAQRQPGTDALAPRPKAPHPTTTSQDIAVVCIDDDDDDTTTSSPKTPTPIRVCSNPQRTPPARTRARTTSQHLFDHGFWQSSHTHDTTTQPPVDSTNEQSATPPPRPSYPVSSARRRRMPSVSGQTRLMRLRTASFATPTPTSRKPIAPVTPLRINLPPPPQCHYHHSAAASADMRDPATRRTRPPKRKAQDSDDDDDDEHEDNNGDDQSASPTKRVRIWSAAVRPFSSPYRPPPLPHKIYSPVGQNNDDNDSYEKQRNSPFSSSSGPAGASPTRTWSGTTMVMGRRRPTTSPPRPPPRRGTCSSDGEDARPRGGGMRAVGEAAVQFPTAYFFQGLGKAVEELMPFMGVGGGSWRSGGELGAYYGGTETGSGTGTLVRAGREGEWEEDEDDDDDDDEEGEGEDEDEEEG